jgi:hypothetical protein
MDSSGLDTANIDLSKLTDRDKQELQAFITNETQVSLSPLALEPGELMFFAESKNSTMLVPSYGFSLHDATRATPYTYPLNFAPAKQAQPSHPHHTLNIENIRRKSANSWVV